MATNYGVNATKRDNQAIPQLVPQGEAKSPLLVAYDTFELSAALAAGDNIYVMKLPPLARVHEVKVFFDQLDASGGDLDVGWLANGVDSLSVNGLIDGADITSAGMVSMNDDFPTSAGNFKQFGNAETQIVITATASGGWDQTSGTVSISIEYTVS